MTTGGAADHAVDPDDPTPLYHQVYLIWRRRIVDGSLSFGARLPSEEELSRRHGISRITAKRAMNELAAEGLVERNRGRGTTVALKAASRPMTMDFGGLIENLNTIGSSTTVDVLSFDYVRAPADVADALHLPPGATAQRVQRRRNLRGEPFSHMLTWLPEDIGRSFERGDLAAQPIVSLIEAAGHRIASARQSVTAHAADPSLAHALSIRVGAPLLRVTRVISDDADRPVQFITVDYRPELYRLDLVLNRVDDAEGGGRIWTTAAE